ncbi:MAG: glycosyltransferase family 2 protein [Proteobacteria bacterium]|nr:glycosyltransferase family 2 protein [Pseudomonadota bacterium]
MYKNNMISTVIPVYNEEETIPALCRRLKAVIESWDYRSEMIFVNDGSIDNFLELLKDLNKTFPEVVNVVNFSRNFGHQPALTAGIDQALGDVVILMDGDLQDTPESLPEMIEQWETGFDVVYAIRAKRNESFLKRLAFKLYYQIQSRVVDFKIPLDAGIFSLMDRKMVDVPRDISRKYLRDTMYQRFC